MTENYLEAPEGQRKPSCVIKEVLNLFQEQVCVAERRETWLGWDGWVATGGVPLATREQGPEAPADAD